MDIEKISHGKYKNALLYAILASVIIVVASALVGRAALNLDAALTEKPDLALFLLLPEEDIEYSTVLREQEHERDYLIETPDGEKFIKLQKDLSTSEWFVAHRETVR